METIYVKQNLRLGEAYLVSVHLYFQDRRFKKAILISMLPLVIVTVYTLAYGTKGLDYSRMPLALLLPALVFFVIFIFPLLFSAYRMLTVPAEKLTLYMKLDETGVITARDTKEAIRKWPEFNYWEETGSFFYLYFSPYKTVAHVIVKRTLSDQQLEATRALLEKSLPAK